MERFATLILRYRALILTVVALITLLFGYALRNIKIMTNFGDLLPKTHPYIKIHDEFRKIFGGANFLVMLLEVKEGDIFNYTTLGKVKYISQELFDAPGIDRFKILSLAESKVKDFKYTSWGFSTTPLMWPTIPQNEKEMEQLKDSIWSNPSYYGSFVSFDNKKTLILADFLEETLDYSLIYKELNRIRSNVEDENHILSIVGYPMNLGAVQSMIQRVTYIMLGTALVIPPAFSNLSFPVAEDYCSLIRHHLRHLGPRFYEHARPQPGSPGVCAAVFDFPDGISPRPSALQPVL